MKKQATTILLESRKRQELLDQLAQTVEYFVDKENHDRFDYSVKAAIMGEVVTIINSLRTSVEAQLFSIIGDSYTNTTYTAFDFIIASPVPQFLHLQEIQQYYTKELALLIAEVTQEATEANFIDDGLGQGHPNSAGTALVGNTPNIVYAKGATWTSSEDELITSLGVINAALMGDVPNVS